MNILKKFAVSLTALTTLATLSIGSFSVSANELTKVNTNLLSDTATAEDKFVASYKKADEQLAANYYLENGISLEDAKTMMDIYQEGALQIAASNNSIARSYSTGANFYNTSYLSQNQHYGVVIANNGSACTGISLNLNYEPNWIGFNSSLGANVLDNTSNITSTLISSLNLVTIGGTYIGNKTTETPAGVVEIPFNVVMTEGNHGNESYSEGTLYHKFTFERASSNPIMGDSTFCYETYVNGDVNHDGRVNSIDANYLTQYNLGEITLDNVAFTYTDKSSEIAKIVNDRAMDANKDGYVGIADITRINETLE